RKDEAAETGTQLVHFGGTEDMGFGYRKEPIPLRVSARVGQSRVSAQGPGNVALIPEPTAGNLVLAVSHHAVVGDRVLIVIDRRDTRKETGKRAARNSRTAGLTWPGNKERSAILSALEVQNINSNRVNLPCG